MNIPVLEKIIKITKDSFSGNGNPNPQRDWIYLITAGCVALVISVSLSYISSRTLSEEPSVEATSTTNEVKTTSLETVQRIFQIRLSEREKYERTLHFVDPSQ